MCGICGIINFHRNPIQKTLIYKMMQTQKHRGPDDEGIFVENNVGLGFVRLSILDLSPAGKQPMYYGRSDGKKSEKKGKNERYVIVYNGEIYNYIELRQELESLGYQFETRTDTEVLLASYMHWGEECLHRFNGMWAFVIYDRIKKRIFGARDRYGIKPFYYFVKENAFVFSSEILPLLDQLPTKAKPDDLSIYDYLVYNRTDQTERTFFQDIKKLQHGCSLTIENGKYLIARWYELKAKVQSQKAFSDPREYRELLSSSVGLRLRSDVPVGVCLSGGLDSSSIVSILLKDFKKHDVHTFSAVYGEGRCGDESFYIREYENALQNMHFVTPDSESLREDLQIFIRAHGEPIPSTTPYAQYKVMELAKDHVVVTLDGQGADEKLAGYHYFFGFYFKELLRKARLPKLGWELFNYIIKHRSLFGLQSWIYLLLPEKYRIEARIGQKGYLRKDFVDFHKKSDIIAGNLHGSNSLNDALLDHFEYKLEHLLKWEDRNSMWFSLEARVPFLDYRLVEKTLATSSDMIIRSGMTKSLLRDAMKGILPENIRRRRDKIGFDTPQAEWFRAAEWQAIIRNVIQSRSFKDRQYIDPEKAQDLYQLHLEGKTDISREIWKWIHLEYWHRTFID